jgi:hypothetical protein
MWAMVPTEAVAEVAADTSESAIVEVGANHTDAGMQPEAGEAEIDMADDMQPVEPVALSAQDDTSEKATDTLTATTRALMQAWPQRGSRLKSWRGSR